MNEVLEILKAGKEFFTGGDLVAFYAVYIIASKVILPIYKNGKRLSKLIDSLTQSLNDGLFSHAEIVVELKALNRILTKTTPTYDDDTP